MWYNAISICFFLLVIHGPNLTGAEGFIDKPPTNQVVYPGEQAAFKCEVKADSLATWRINNTNITMLPDETRNNIRIEDIGLTKTLFITAKEEYNNTIVQCIAVKLKEDMSAKVTLTIQGQLASVGEVTVQSNNVSISLSWNPPFTLNVTESEIDIYYTVNIINMTSTEPTTVSYTKCVNIAQPNCTFSSSYPNPCHKYRFVVIPKNGAGNGNESTVQGAFLGVNGSELIATRSFLDGNSKGSRVNIGLTQPKFQDCNIIYTLYFIVVPSSNEGCLKSSKCDPQEQNMQLFCDANGRKLPLNCIYKVIIESTSDGGKANSTGNILLSTYDVQKVSVEGVKGAIKVNGQLAKNTDALGCLIVANLSSSISDQYFQRAPIKNSFCNTTVLNLEEGNYSVLVYDLEENGLPGCTPAFTMTGVAVGSSSPTSVSHFTSIIAVAIALLLALQLATGLQWE